MIFSKVGVTEAQFFKKICYFERFYTVEKPDKSINIQNPSIAYAQFEMISCFPTYLSVLLCCYSGRNAVRHSFRLRRGRRSRRFVHFLHGFEVSGSCNILLKLTWLLLCLVSLGDVAEVDFGLPLSLPLYPRVVRDVFHELLPLEKSSLF